MPRSSRHRSVKSRGVEDQTYSEDEMESTDQNQRLDELENGKSSSKMNVVADKGLKAVAFEAESSQKSARQKISIDDPKSRSSRGHEDSTGRYKENGGKPRQEKDGKEREKDCKSEREIVRDLEKERSDVASGRKRGDETGGSEGEIVTKKVKENGGWQIKDELRNPELEKELEIRMGRRDGSGDKDKWHKDGRESGEGRGRESDDRRRKESGVKRLSSKDDCRRSGNYKDEGHRDGRYSKDKYGEELDRDHRHRDERSSNNHASDRHHNEHIKEDKSPQSHDKKRKPLSQEHIKDDKSPESHHKKSKIQSRGHDDDPFVEDHRTKSKDNRDRDHRHRDERSSNIHVSDRHQNEHMKEEKSPQSHDKKRKAQERNKDDKSPESNHKKSKLQAGGHDDDPFVENQRTKSKHNIDRKRSCDQDEDHRDLRLRSKKQLCVDAEDERTKSKDNRDRRRSSDQNDDHRDSRLRDKKQPRVDIQKSTLNFCKLESDYHIARDRSENRHPEKVDSSVCDNGSKNATNTHVIMHPRRCSSKQGESTRRETLLQEKVCASRAGSIVDNRSTSGSHKRDSESRSENKTKAKDHRSLDGVPKYEASGLDASIKLTKKSPSTIDRRDSIRSVSRHSLNMGETGHNREHLSAGSSCLRNRASLPPPPPLMPRFDLGSFEDENRYQSGRSHGNGLRSFSPWPPVANDFMPLQHGPPPSPFHSFSWQLPGHPSLFGPRLPMHINPSMVPYPGHGHMFGWHDSQLQGWCGNNNGFPEGPHAYGWERNSDMWKGERSNSSMELPAHQESEYVDDTLVGNSGHESQAHQDQPDRRTEACQSHAIETPSKAMNEKTTEPTNQICCTYLLDIDVSPPLTFPVLYKQCKDLLGTRDAHGCPEHVKEDADATTKSSNFRGSLLPMAKDSVFQRATPSFKKQKEASRLKFSVLHVLPKEERNSPPEVSNMEAVEAISGPNDPGEASAVEAVKAAHHIFEEMSDANATAAATHAEEELEANDVRGNDNEERPVFVISSSQECEELVVPDCGVIVSGRQNIHSGSTH